MISRDHSASIISLYELAMTSTSAFAVLPFLGLNARRSIRTVCRYESKRKKERKEREKKAKRKKKKEERAGRGREKNGRAIGRTFRAESARIVYAPIKHHGREESFSLSFPMDYAMTGYRTETAGRAATNK
jgi:hypothetical protein